MEDDALAVLEENLRKRSRDKFFDGFKETIPGMLNYLQQLEREVLAEVNNIKRAKAEKVQ